MVNKSGLLSSEEARFWDSTHPHNTYITFMHLEDDCKWFLGMGWFQGTVYRIISQIKGFIRWQKRNQEVLKGNFFCAKTPQL